MTASRAMLASGSAATAGDGRRSAAVDSSASSVSLSVGPLRALLSFRLSDLLFLSLGCCALLASLGRQGEWRLQQHSVIAHSVGLSSSSEPPSSSFAASIGPRPRPQPLVADLDGDNTNGTPAAPVIERAVQQVPASQATSATAALTCSPLLCWLCVCCAACVHQS